MNKIHKTLAVAAAVIAGINVWNVQSTSTEMDLLLGDVECMAQPEQNGQNNSGSGQSVTLTAKISNDDQYQIEGQYTSSNGFSGSVGYGSSDHWKFKAQIPIDEHVTIELNYCTSGSGSCTVRIKF